MGLKATVAGIWLAKREKTWRPPSVYAVADTPFNLFTIVGGPVKIYSLVAHLTTAITLAGTWHFLLGAVLLDTALFANIGNAGETVVVPLNVGAAVIAPAQGSPVPSILAAAFNVFSITAAPANIILALGGAADVDGLVSFTVEWERLSPAANIVVA